ncbi:MAG: tyrosine-protein phosphatase [Rhodococcus sp.]|nr:tyrosine-protein phosphatase [Rhodococcus sp. (in: high G+C Gram-positive bacteria)]
MTHPSRPDLASRRLVLLASVPNFRDIGGYGIRDGGTVRTGALYRSTDLSRITDDDAPVVASLGIATVYDLRTAVERERAPDKLPAGANPVVLDVLAGRGGSAITAQMLRVVADPSIAETELGGGQAARYFEGSYRDFVTLPSAVDAYRTMFEGLSALENLPALVHCTTGKDRTGWATAALLLLLGVDENDVYDDYLLTNDYLLPALSGVFEAFAAQGGDPALLEPVLGVQRSYLDSALAAMTEHFGTIENYFGDGLGIDSDGQARLRDLLVVTAER